MSTVNIVNKWKIFCNSQGWQKEAQAARLGIEWADYLIMFNGRTFPDWALEKMERIIEGRYILDQAVIKTTLLLEMEEFIKRGLNDKIMVTLAAPTGQGKTMAAKHLALQYQCKYYHVLVELQKPKVASIRNFVRELNVTYGVREKSTNNLRHLINNIHSDKRAVLLIDEGQRLITEDWGYFKVLQDIFDTVPNLSIVLLGNYRFYSNMFIDATHTYKGINEEEQFLRRMSIVQRLPRLQKNDVKLWAEYNNIASLNNSDYKRLAEFFSLRAALGDLEEVRKELVRIMGRGAVKAWSDVTADKIIAVYELMHTKTKEVKDEGQREGLEEYSETSVSANIANVG